MQLDRHCPVQFPQYAVHTIAETQFLLLRLDMQITGFHADRMLQQFIRQSHDWRLFPVFCPMPPHHHDTILHIVQGLMRQPL